MAGSAADWKDMMPATITHAEFSARSAYGAPQFGTPVSYRARVVYKPRLVRGADGAEVISPVTVWLAEYVNVGAQDQITLPDGTTPTVIAVEKVPDEVGAHHTRIALGA